MSEKGSNEQEQQPQQHSVQELNFSLNDILSQDHDVNDSSFQSIVQTLSNNNNSTDHVTPSYAHLPAELQDLFSNETDDLLSPQGSHSDASMLQADMMWQQPYMSSPLSTPSVSAPTPPIVSVTPTPPPPPVTPLTSASATPATPVTAAVTIPAVATPPQPVSAPTTPAQATPPTPAAVPNTVTSVSTPPATTPTTAAVASPGVGVASPAASSVTSSTTLLDNITSQLPPERKDRFIQLFRELQTNAVSAADFLLQAKSLLGQQQYQQLEDLKNKPAQLVQKPIRPVPEKRILSSSQIRAEDAQRSMHGIM